jgi:hypothetical protein
MEPIEQHAHFEKLHPRVATERAAAKNVADVYALHKLNEQVNTTVYAEVFQRRLKALDDDTRLKQQLGLDVYDKSIRSMARAVTLLGFTTQDLVYIFGLEE